MADSRPFREAFIRSFLSSTSLREVLHALIEACYARARAAPDDRGAITWRDIAGRLTEIEDAAQDLNL